MTTMIEGVPVKTLKNLKIFNYPEFTKMSPVELKDAIKEKGLFISGWPIIGVRNAFGHGEGYAIGFTEPENPVNPLREEVAIVTSGNTDQYIAPNPENTVVTTGSYAWLKVLMLEPRIDNQELDTLIVKLARTVMGAPTAATSLVPISKQTVTECKAVVKKRLATRSEASYTAISVIVDYSADRVIVETASNAVAKRVLRLLGQVTAPADALESMGALGVLGAEAPVDKDESKTKGTADVKDKSKEEEELTNFEKSVTEFLAKAVLNANLENPNLKILETNPDKVWDIFKIDKPTSKTLLSNATFGVGAKAYEVPASFRNRVTRALRANKDSLSEGEIARVETAVKIFDSIESSMESEDAWLCEKVIVIPLNDSSTRASGPQVFFPEHRGLDPKANTWVTEGAVSTIKYLHYSRKIEIDPNICLKFNKVEGSIVAGMNDVSFTLSENKMSLSTVYGGAKHTQLFPDSLSGAHDEVATRIDSSLGIYDKATLEAKKVAIEGAALYIGLCLLGRALETARDES